MVYVATSKNDVVAFSEEDLRAGATKHLWLRNLGDPVIVGIKDYSNIPDPVGVCSTMVLDPGSRRLFVVAMVDSGVGIGMDRAIYHVVALDVDTGAPVAQATLNPKPSPPGSPLEKLSFVSGDHDQRCALLLVNSTYLYICFASFQSGDGGTYKGWVVRCEAADLSRQEYLPITQRVTGGGIWGPGGATEAGGSLFVVTGNAPKLDDRGNTYWDQLHGAPPGQFDDFFEAVVKLNLHPMVDDWYMPKDIKALNDKDQDLGGSSALFASVGPPGMRYVLVTGDKAGNVYLLDPSDLGQWGGERWREKRFNGEVHCAPAYYKSARLADWYGNDDIVVLTAHCDPGMIAFRIDTRPALTEVWQARTSYGASIAFDIANGSPLVVDTATDGLNISGGPRGMVWVCDGGKNPPHVLRAVSMEDGIEVWSSAWNPTADGLPEVPHYPAVSCSDHSVFVGTNEGLACYRLPWLAQPTGPQFLVYNLDTPAGENHGYYRLSDGVSNTGVASWGSAPNLVPGWFGQHDAPAGGMIATALRDIGKLDLVVFWIDSRDDGNHAFYRIGWDVGVSGRPQWDPVKGTVEVNELPWGTRAQGGGLAVAHLSVGGRPDLVLFHIDHPGGGNQGFYSIGWSLNSDGRATHWTRLPVNAWFGEQSAGGGIAVGAISGPASQDLVVFHLDHASGGNKGWYQIGWNLGGDGTVKTWDSRMRIPVPGWFGEHTQGASVAITDLDGDGRPELIIFHIDHASGANVGYYRIGWCLNTTGEVTGGWTTDSGDPFKVPGWFGTESCAGSLAVVQFPWRWAWE